MRRRTWTLFLATALGLPLAFLGLAPLAAAHLEREASASWRLAGQPIEDLPARYPRSSANESARRVAELAAPMGIEFSRPGPWGPGLRPLHGHVEARLAGRAGPAPEPLQRFRIEHAGAMEALVRQLATDGVPRFELDVSNALETIPNLRAVLVLGNLLALEALERPEDGQALVALWNLSTGLRERPEAASVLVAVKLDRLALSIARRLDSVPAELASRLDKVDYGEALQRDLQTMTWLHRQHAEAGGVRGTERPRLLAGLSGPFGRRLLRLRAADSSRALAQVVGALRERSRCEPPDALGLARFGGWNTHRPVHLPLGQIWSALLGAQLDVELTRNVLALRAQRGHDGAWPAALADTGSQVCPGVSWRYTRHPDGGVGLAWGGSEPQHELATLTFEAGLR